MISGGTGCPAQLKNQAVLNITEGHGQVLFDSYLTDSGTQPELLNRKSCNLRLPISHLDGVKIGVRLVDVKGYILQSKKVSSSLSAQVSFVGQNSQPLTKSWIDRLSQNYSLQLDLTSQNDYTWSSCSSGNVLLTINTSLLSVRKKSSQVAQLSMDELNFDFIVRRCN